jgi:ParB/RepB/Spo0J family partition protein
MSQKEFLENQRKKKKQSSSPRVQRIFDVDPNTVSTFYVHPNQVIKWKFKDRQNIDLHEESIKEMAQQFSDPNIGQIEACKVRHIESGPQNSYELISGERRWRASMLMDKPRLKIEVDPDVNDKTCWLKQFAENTNRYDISDFSKYESALKIINATDGLDRDILAKELGLSRQEKAKLFSYDKIPKKIFNSIVDFSKVSRFTVEKINNITNHKKNNKYNVDSVIDFICTLSDEIREGKIGREKLNEKVNDFLFENDNQNFTWLKWDKERLSLTPKAQMLLNNKNICREKLNSDLIRVFEKHMNKK